MSVYVVAQLKFLNEKTYRRYQARFAGVFEKYPGRLLAADEQAVVLEGDWHGDKVVLMVFPDEQDARSFLESPEYRDISKDRKIGSETLALLVRGLN